jgi:MFS superfamily sulfate permease-like transporter
MTSAQVLEEWRTTIDARKKELLITRASLDQLRAKEQVLVDEIDRDEHQFQHVQDLIKGEAAAAKTP